MEVRLGASGLLLTGCDAVLTRTQEWEYIWKSPYKLTLVRCLFVLARYLALLIHVWVSLPVYEVKTNAFYFSTDVALASIMTAKYQRPKRTPEHLCMPFLVFHVISGQSMLFVLHLILTLRVYALYNKSRTVGVFLLTLLVGGFAGSTVSVVRGCLHATIKSVGPCLHSRPERPLLILLCGELLIQLILHGLTWKRTIWDFRRFTLLPSALLSVLNRDGLKIFTGTSVAIIATAILKRGTLIAFVFPFLISFVSASGTRAILHLQILSASNQATPSLLKSSKEVELTTIDFTTWEAPWSTSTFLDPEQ
ncbi:hypothetical protein GYMLUDRAFT_245329 [Collybiopsis luxurians FD-317 M1]|uniref:DUF6533 domain-containing protein n=1 Tax=Collybiopsis luxurians FD-317 M1 TaxID=944289 RepID=A0A0D0C9U7_9AGAR|nr:hypothetical protein GYMLUDRAFT_245329 [Collybiopsis luxurians FD-317 M1]